MPIQSIHKTKTFQKVRKKRWTDTKKQPTKLQPLNVRRKLKRVYFAPNLRIVQPSVQPTLRSLVRDEKYNSGYVIGGPLFVRGTVAEFASTNPQELLYVADDGSIQGFPIPELSDSTFALTHHDSRLEWSNQDTAPRSKNDLPDFSFVANYEQPTLFLESGSTQCVIGMEPTTLRFWNQLTMTEDDSQYTLINGTFAEIKQSGLYQINIYLITREQTSTIGKRRVLLNVSYELFNDQKESDDDDDFVSTETQLILNEQQPAADIDSDCVHYVLRLVNLQQNDIISLQYQIVDSTDEDQTCVLPNSVWSMKLIETSKDEQEEESCSFSSSNTSEPDLMESTSSQEIFMVSEESNPDFEQN
jgi:hypothetical protein